MFLRKLFFLQVVLIISSLQNTFQDSVTKITSNRCDRISRYEFQNCYFIESTGWIPPKPMESPVSQIIDVGADKLLGIFLPKKYLTKKILMMKTWCHKVFMGLREKVEGLHGFERKSRIKTYFDSKSHHTMWRCQNICAWIFRDFAQIWYITLRGCSFTPAYRVKWFGSTLLKEIISQHRIIH